MDNNKEVYKVELDPAPFIAGIKKAIDAYSVFSKEINKRLKVNLDQRDMVRLANLIGKEFKKVADQITGSLNPALAQVGKNAGQAMGTLATGANAATSAIQKTGQAAKLTAGQIATVNGQVGRLSAQTERAAETAIAKLKRAQAAIRDQASIKTDARGLVAEDLLAFNPPRTAKGTGSFSVDSRKVDQFRAETAAILREQRIRDAAARQSAAGEQRIGEVAEDRAQQAIKDRIAAEKKKADFIKQLQREIASGVLGGLRNEERLAAQLEKEIALMQRAKEIAQQLNAIRTKAGIFDVQRPPEHFISNGAINQSAAAAGRSSANADVRANNAVTAGLGRDAVQAQAQALRNQAAAQREVDKAAKGLLQTHTGVNLKLIEQGARLLKFIVYYRIIQDSLRAIENGVRSIVGAGIEYSKALETQRLGLIGILAENFKVRDAQGTLLSGTTMYTRLQGEAAKQWAQIQAASLSVVGTTEDLMGLYEGILPFASKLGKNLADVQQLTKATAIAASLMNISFSDARTAIISLLQGRALTRNRLVSALGFEEKDVSRLKGTPALFDKVLSKLDSFAVLGKEAQGTVAALQESFKEFTGVIGAQFVSPFLTGFKQFMGDVGINGQSGSGLMGLLFEGQDAGGLRLKGSVSEFFRFVRTATEQAVEPVRAFAKQLSDGGINSAYVFGQGVANAAKGVVSLVVNLTRAGVVFTNFVAKNSELVKYLGMAVAGFAAFNVLNNVRKWILATAQAYNFLKVSAAAAATAEKAAVAASTQWTIGAGLAATATRTLATVATALPYAAIAVGIGVIASKLLDWANNAKAARDAQSRLAAGDPTGAVAASAQNRQSDDPSVFMPAYKVYEQGLTALQEKLGKLSQKNVLLKDLRKDAINIVEVYDELGKAEEANNKAIATGVGLSKARLEELHKRNIEIEEAKALTKDVIAEIKDFTSGAAGDLEAKINELTAKKLAAQKDFVNADPNDPRKTQFLLNSIKDTNARIQELADERAKIFYTMSVAARALNNLSAKDAVGFEPIPSDGTDDPTSRAPFHSAAEDKLREEELYFNTRSRILSEFHSRELISDGAFETQSERLEQDHFERSLNLLKEKRAEYDAEVAKYKGTKAAFTQDEIDNVTRDIKNQALAIEADIEVASAKRDASHQDRLRKIGTLAVDTALSVDAELAGIFGFADEKLEATLEKMATDIEKAFRNLNAEELGKGFADRVRESIPQARDFKAAGMEAHNLELSLGDLQSAQQDLDLGYQTGRVSLDRYIDGTRQNRAEQIRLLEALRGVIAFQRNIVAQQQNIVDPNDSRLQEYTNQINDLTRQLGVLHAAAGTAAQAVDALSNVFSAFSSIASVFDPINDGVSKFIGGLGSVVAIGGQVAGLAKTLGAVKATFKNLIPEGGKGGPKGILGAFGFGAQGSTMAAVTGGLSIAATAAFAIGSAIFKRNVEKAKKDIESGIKAIADSVANGSRDIGVGLADLQRKRAEAVSKYSKSKSGRSALKDELPKIDEQIQQLQEKIKGIRQAFEETLKGLRVGNGPFGDFAKQLFDLEKTTREYLATFDPANIAEYGQALANVTEMYDLTLKALRETLQSQLNSFEQEAVGAMNRVFDLLDEKKNLVQQLADLSEQQVEIDKELADLPNQELRHLRDIKDAEKDLQRAKEDHLKRVYDAQKRIADILKAAAQSEADVRRRGLVEAQLSIAQQKAQEISDIRAKAQEDLSDAQQQLRDAQEDTDVQDAQERLIELKKDTALIDKRADLEKRQRRLSDQVERVHEEQAFNEIRLEGATRIAKLEGDIFGLGMDRVGLAQRQSDLEFEAAQAQVKKWQDTKALVDGIVASAGGILFTPPPGFPQIRVQIGDIVINQQDLSTNVSNSTTNNRSPEMRDKYDEDADRRYPNYLIP